MTTNKQYTLYLSRNSTPEIMSHTYGDFCHVKYNSKNVLTFRIVVKDGPIVGSPRATVCVCSAFHQSSTRLFATFKRLTHYMTSFSHAFIILRHSTATRDAVRPTLPDGQAKICSKNRKNRNIILH